MKPDYRQQCSRCRYQHDSYRTCPAQGKQCNYCGGKGHFEKTCFKKNLCQPLKSLSAIISHISTQTKQGRINMHTNAGGSHETQFVIDMGSDWTAINSDNLTRLGLKPQDPKTPTKQMQSTATAMAEKMNPHGFIEAQLRFGTGVVTPSSLRELQHPCSASQR